MAMSIIKPDDYVFACSEGDVHHDGGHDGGDQAQASRATCCGSEANFVLK